MISLKVKTQGPPSSSTTDSKFTSASTTSKIDSGREEAAGQCLSKRPSITKAEEWKSQALSTKRTTRGQPNR
jgi:hypothetical protein